MVLADTGTLKNDTMNHGVSRHTSPTHGFSKNGPTPLPDAHEHGPSAHLIRALQLAASKARRMATLVHDSDGKDAFLDLAAGMEAWLEQQDSFHGLASLVLAAHALVAYYSPSLPLSATHAMGLYLTIVERELRALGVPVWSVA